MCMCEQVCREWRGICSHAETCDSLWRGLWQARPWTAPGVTPRTHKHARTPAPTQAAPARWCAVGKQRARLRPVRLASARWRYAQPGPCAGIGMASNSALLCAPRRRPRAARRSHRGGAQGRHGGWRPGAARLRTPSSAGDAAAGGCGAACRRGGCGRAGPRGAGAVEGVVQGEALRRSRPEPGGKQHRGGEHGATGAAQVGPRAPTPAAGGKARAALAFATCVEALPPYPASAAAGARNRVKLIQAS